MAAPASAQILAVTGYNPTRSNLRVELIALRRVDTKSVIKYKRPSPVYHVSLKKTAHIVVYEETLKSS
jgi:hypothetical protein